MCAGTGPPGLWPQHWQTQNDGIHGLRDRMVEGPSAIPASTAPMRLKRRLHAPAEVFGAKAEQPQRRYGHKVGAELDKLSDAGRI
jgi:hypothetical protein